MKSAALTIPLSAAFALSLWSPSAQAVDVLRTHVSHGTANCQAALPVFDGNIRKRPKAIANEGSSVAFITCDFEHAPNAVRRITSVGIYFQNRAAGTALVSCTLVQGFGETQFDVNVTKSQGIAANGEALLVWSSDDYNGNKLTAPAASCSLPPGVEIYGTQLDFPEGVGA